ncbi:polysaccharide lyase [Chitinophaga pendula]|uniref:heparin lyase I family protein n=1 Tax=Chitinophaga TaxID=79328 RepID=UPI000BAFA50D|nr:MULTISPECIES: heparin lyase I family protein [Chitinophaga]ASZ13219.1 hypothetical protein CK934_20765 [Chitinophaga sp. MD30]UCJ09161.1 polysaccharide lyase [Chitinophaga pendula]
MKTCLQLVTCFSLCILSLHSCSRQQDLPGPLSSSPVVTEAAGSLRTVFWDGDASRGAAAVWKVQNIEGQGTITAVHDGVNGKIWRFDKPVGSHRTEGHGAKGYQAAEGSDIYIGWRSKLVMSVNEVTNALFQWKAYGGDMQQNFPIVIKTTGGQLRLFHFAPGKIGTELWSVPVAADVWQSYVLRIKVSRDASVGFIEFWYNGQAQSLKTGGQRYYARTLDADYCDPKWGVYGADASAITNYVDRLRIGSTYADAAP